MEQNASFSRQGGCGVSILGDIQNPAGHSPEQPAIADPTLNQGIYMDDLQRCLSTSAIL